MGEQDRIESIQLSSKVSVINQNENEAFYGEIVSINPGSMGIHAERFVEPDSKMQVTLTFSYLDGKEYRESIQGWLIWHDSASHLLGVIFPEMDERENSYLISYLSGIDRRKATEQVSK